MIKLGVNIDHVATLRQARYREAPDSPHAEPSLLDAARAAVAGGADSITVHLREDRRHIIDADVALLRRELAVPMNLEMGNAPEIVAIARQTKPAYACLVPENRAEVTTEGGLDVAGNRAAVAETVAALQANGTKVSLFIDAEPAQVEAAAATGAAMIELHTGAFANAQGAAREAEVAKLAEAARLVRRRAAVNLHAGSRPARKSPSSARAAPRQK
ncbi:MAG: pyridoxine 5'-phosphate synthase [Verrucomicrobiales bacterium]